MKINTYLDKVRKYVSSIFYPVSLGVLTFLIWLLPMPFTYVFSAIYTLLAFFPLLSEDGRAYTALLIFPIISQSENISLDSITGYALMMIIGTVLSVLLYLFIHKKEFVRGNLLIPLVSMFLIFLISYAIHGVMSKAVDKTGLVFLAFLFAQCLIYSLLCTMLGKGDTFPYLCRSIVCFSLTISLEIFVFFLKNGFEIAPVNFSLGWSYTIQSASSLLCMTLPFYGILIYSKKWAWIFGELFVLASILLLSTDSALLSLLFAFIPLILLSFRSYGKLYSYISLIMIVTIGITLISLILTNASFARRLFDTLSSLNLFHEPEGFRKDQFEASVNLFRSSPIIGTSISSFSNINHTLSFSNNTILTIAVLGGGIGLFAYLVYEITLYVSTMKNDNPDKWIYLVFLLMLEMIGLIDNTIFNLGIFQLLLVSHACFEMTNRQEDIIVHDEFYRYYRKKPGSLT